MKTREQRNVNVTSSERLALGDLALEIGAVTKSVQVAAQGTPVQTQSQERSAVITTDQMTALASRSREVGIATGTKAGVSAATGAQCAFVDPNRNQGPDQFPQLYLFECHGRRSAERTCFIGDAFNRLLFDRVTEGGSVEWLLGRAPPPSRRGDAKALDC